MDDKNIKMIKLVDLEKIHYFFENKKNKIRYEDKYLWFYFLSQKPMYVNIHTENSEIIKIIQEKHPASHRFVNYMYDIKWPDDIEKNSLELAKSFVRFWISEDLFNLWESLQKIIP
jgi:hypothetical protein